MVDPKDRQAILDSHLSVGPQKAVSYLPTETIRTLLGQSIEEYRASAAALGHESVAFSAEQSCIKSGAVYVFSRLDLGKILAAHRTTLSACGWPAEVDDFLARATVGWLDEEHPVAPIIKQAFGD